MKTPDLLFIALVAADYIDEINTSNNEENQSAGLRTGYKPDNYLQTIPEHTEICSLEEIGSRTGTVFEVFANNNQNLSKNALFDTGASKSVLSHNTFIKLKLDELESLGALGKTRCEIQINDRTFYQTFIVCEHLKRPLILGRDFSIQNHMGISWTKHNTRQLTQYNEVIAETKEYQPMSRSAVSLKNKVPPRSCAVVDLDVNTMEQIKVEIQPDELWLNLNPNICTYPLIADLSERKRNVERNNTFHNSKLQSTMSTYISQRTML